MQERSLINATRQQEEIRRSHGRRFLWGIMLYLVLLFVLVPGQTFAANAPQLNKSKLTLSVGKSCRLKIKNYRKSVTWKSSNPYVAKVSKKGNVTAKHMGFTTITAQAGSTQLSCLVTVPGSKQQKPYIFCYETDHDGKTIETGGFYNFAVMNGADRSWTWSIDNPNMALLYQDGNSVTENTLAGRNCQLVETFMGKPGTVILTAKSGSTILRYKIMIHQSSEDVLYMDMRRQILAQVLKPGMKPQEQCLAVAKWLSDYASYIITNGPDYSLLKYQYGQCYHYAKTYQFLMAGTAVPCDYVCTAEHAWNQVQIDGQWYNIDVTGFDTDRDVNPYDYTFFLVSDAAFWKKEARMKPYHQCVSKRYDFGVHYSSSPWANGTWKDF